ncbi:MAG: hypothetical protein KGJ70_05020, partial [Gemmatimonadota bacterium]|nr:hypothetical protein [Gemmatimonadota bacterium]
RATPALALLLALSAPAAGAQRAFPVTQVRSYLSATAPIAGAWEAQVHLYEYASPARQALDEVKAGLGAEYAGGPWKSLLGWEHVAGVSGGAHVTEERFFVEGTAERRLAPWLAARDLQKIEVRDMAVGWASRWTNRVRADLGDAELPLATPWVGRQWSYDARYREVNKSTWLYGVRLHAPGRLGVELYFYDETDVARTPRRMTAACLTLSVRG